MNKLARIFLFLTAALFLLSSCNDGKSYADLLKEEDRAVKAFLANKIVINEIPADSVFITLQDVPDNDTLAVPYYKLDNDGNVYMQVLEPGDMNDRSEKGNDVNLRFLRYDLKALVAGSNPSPVGNTNPSDYITIRFGETTLSSTTQYGTGIQYPMYFLGNECRVNLLIRAKAGFTAETSTVMPYLYYVQYNKSK